MEDLNTFAADCVVVSCCCNCLVLQIAIFIFLGLPQKLVKNTRKCYAKWGVNRRIKRMGLGCECRENTGVDSDSRKESMSMEMEGFGCIEEVEEALEEFSKNGEFLFGSFWGKERIQNSSSVSSCGNHDTFDLRFVSRYEIVEENFYSDYIFTTSHSLYRNQWK
uniref:Transmembrane protein n=1 Tax=Noccaea caerulescens TaxID=107243 RepID=A0A1J3EPD9_NOCCA